MAPCLLSSKAKGNRITEGAYPNGKIKKIRDKADSGQLLGDKNTDIDK